MSGFDGPPESNGRWSRAAFLGAAAVCVAFAISRVAFHRTGIRFDAGTLPWFWQFIGPHLLETDLARSLFYLHSQPPLFNLFLGVVLRFAPSHPTAAFSVLFLLAGVVLELALYATLLRLRVSPWLAAALAVVFLIGPASVLYENWLFYTYPLTAALALSALFLHRFLAGGRARDGAVFFALVAAMALTWSVFHLVWCAICAGLAAALLPGRGRLRVMTLAAAPLLVVVALYLKNWMVFGTLNASSWAGMSLAKMVLLRAPVDERLALMQEGTLSLLALTPPFSPLDEYPERYREGDVAPVPVLELPRKEGGSPNFNHAAYLGISAQYLKDSRTFLRQRPDLYLQSVGRAFALYALPATDFPFLLQKRTAVERWDTAYNRWVLGAIRSQPAWQRCVNHEDDACVRRNIAYGWMTVSLAVTLAGLVFGWRAFGGRASARAAAHSGTLLFLSLNVLWIAVVGNLAELGENNRFRFTTDPLVVMLIGAVASEVWWRLVPSVRSRRGRAGEAPPLRPPG